MFTNYISNIKIINFLFFHIIISFYSYKISSNIQEFVKNDCEVKIFHPKTFVTLQRNLPHCCEHEGCIKKMVINEYPCCHKNVHGEGCLFNDNKMHILIIEFISDKKE